MDKLSTILVVVESTGDARQVLSKSVHLARHFGARIELFLCDNEHAYQLARAYDRTGVERAKALCIEESRRYLEHLVSEARASDVSIHLDVACESPLYESILRKARKCRADLIVKQPSGEHPMRRFTLGPNDWQLARSCPCSLMLVRGNKWLTSPRFAAAIDVSDQETKGLARSIMYTAEYLALGCGAQLEILHSDEGLETAGEARRRRALEDLAAEHHIPFSSIHVLKGAPEKMLPGYATTRAYDVLVMGALTHRGGVAPLVGTLTSHLVDALQCDFVLVKKPPSCDMPEVRETPTTLRAML